MDSRGVAYIAYGEKARVEMERSRDTLRQHHDWPVVVAPELPSTERLTDKQKSRWAKVRLFDWVPFRDTLYLDADTRVQGDLSAGFDVLDDGWDMAMVPSVNQDVDWLWHVGEAEREETRRYYDTQPLQLQGGVFFVRRNYLTETLFAEWASEWRCWEDEDQAALLRALKACPVRMWMLGRAWNGGELVQHLFGRTR